jgi:hypothetical protein
LHRTSAVKDPDSPQEPFPTAQIKIRAFVYRYEHGREKKLPGSVGEAP